MHDTVVHRESGPVPTVPDSDQAGDAPDAGCRIRRTPSWWLAMVLLEVGLAIQVPPRVPAYKMSSTRAVRFAVAGGDVAASH